MPDEMRIQRLLEELLDSNRTPEEVCAGEPNLLPEVRRRWGRIQRVGFQLDELFPPGDSSNLDDARGLNSEITLPQIDGYDVEAILGRGGMGVVFKARQLNLNRPVALKMLLSGSYAGPQELARFRREAEAVAALRHPNIVQVYDVGDLTGRPHLSMEFVEGGSLAQQLAKALPSPRQAAELVATLAVAMQFAHKSGIIHRDLKPANVLLTSDGAPKITDFGLARFVQAGPELTLTGVRLGTPSYMAPEQALGKANDIGPAVDIYALGAILYEMLAGRPPFEGQTAVETERQVVAEEPAPPSRFNAQVPRDVETICLKCLQKNPTRRYASAQDLADDLHRFLDGKPVLARPVGIVERTMKWARRRPALATLLAALLVLLGTAVGDGVWLHRQEDSRRTEKAQREALARQAIEAAIDRAYASAHIERWQEARLILTNARTHLANAGSDEPRSQIEQAEANVEFARKLERIRQGAAATAVVQYFVTPASPLMARSYGEAFARAGFNIDGDEEETAARIRSAPLWEQTVAAIDEWAFAAFMTKNESLQKKLLRIAKLADPDPEWRDRFRDSAGWRDKQILLTLAAEVSKTSKPPAAHQLAIMSALLRNLGEKTDETILLRRALRFRPGDFWLNWEMANALARNRQYAESVTFLRIMVALRPESALTRYRLALALSWANQPEESLAELRRAYDLEPTNGELLHILSMALVHSGQPDKAEAECRRALDAAPNNAMAAFSLGVVFHQQNRTEEAAQMYQKVVLELDPKQIAAWCNLGMAQGANGRFKEAATAFQKTIDLEPTSVYGHYGLGQSSVNLREYPKAIAAFQWVIRELDPKKALAEANLDDPLNTKLFNPNVGDSQDSMYILAQIGLAEGLLGVGRFAEANSVAKHAQESPSTDEPQRSVLRQQIVLSRQLLPLEATLPAILAGKEQPTDVPTQQALAQWLFKYKLFTAASARLCDIVFQEQPLLADNLDSQYRFHAACAAAMAACGLGDDAATIDDKERAALRRKALDWLKADRDALKKRWQVGQFASQSFAARTALEWQKSDSLACVRDEAALTKLPEAERKEWQTLWSDIKTLAARDPSAIIAQARALAARKQWTKAAPIYARLIQDFPSADGEIWFEHAAVQLLSGDRRAYRQTCKLMLERASKGADMRPYLAARACTLAPDSVEDASLLSQVSAVELQRNAGAFWSLTEQGALSYRAGRYDKATPSFEASLRAETRPGAAVLNWLWLAMAYQKLNKPEEARKWLDKANAWLDSLGDAMPSNAETLNLHRHNWLEAHVLRKEMEMLISPVPGKDSMPGR